MLILERYKEGLVWLDVWWVGREFVFVVGMNRKVVYMIVLTCLGRRWWRMMVWRGGAESRFG